MSMNIQTHRPLVVSVHLMHPQMYDMAFGSCVHYTMYYPSVQNEAFKVLKGQLDFCDAHTGYNMVHWERQPVQQRRQPESMGIFFEGPRRQPDKKSTTKISLLDPCIDSLLLWCVDDPQASQVCSIAILAQVSDRVMDEHGKKGALLKKNSTMRKSQLHWQNLLGLESACEKPIAWFEQKGKMPMDTQCEYLKSTVPENEIHSYEKIQQRLKKHYDMDQLHTDYDYFESALVTPVVAYLRQHHALSALGVPTATVRSVGGRVYWGSTFCHPIQEKTSAAQDFITQQRAVHECMALEHTTPKALCVPKKRI